MARKDQDLLAHNFHLKLNTSLADSLTEILDKDSRFLASNNIIDYSVLIGVHYTYKQIKPPVQEQQSEEKAGTGTFHMNSFKVQTLKVFDKFLLFLLLSKFLNLNSFKISIKKEEKVWPSADGTAIYFLGVIDILTYFK